MYHVQDEQGANRDVIKLVKFSDGDFGIVSFDMRFNVRGTLTDAVRALLSLGVSFAQFECAYLEMELLGHNVAEFGVSQNRSYMFSHSVALFDERCGHA